MLSIINSKCIEALLQTCLDMFEHVETCTVKRLKKALKKNSKRGVVILVVIKKSTSKKRRAKMAVTLIVEHEKLSKC